MVTVSQKIVDLKKLSYFERVIICVIQKSLKSVILDALKMFEGLITLITEILGFACSRTKLTHQLRFKRITKWARDYLGAG